MDFSQWDQQNSDMKAAVDQNEKEHQFEQVPVGTYEVRIIDMVLTESKAGDPMLRVDFQILEGQKYGKAHIFMYKVCKDATGINITRGFLGSLTPKDNKISVGFTSMTQFAKDINDLYSQINGKYEYSLEVTENDKGFRNYKIKDIYAATQPAIDNPFDSSEPLPFS